MALAEREIWSPTAQVRSEAGESIVATGAELSTSIVTAAVATAPWLSVTWTEAMWGPDVEKVWVGDDGGGVVELPVAVEIPGVGERVAGVGSVEPEASKLDRERRRPVRGVAVATAAGGRLPSGVVDPPRSCRR